MRRRVPWSWQDAALPAVAGLLVVLAAVVPRFSTSQASDTTVEVTQTTYACPGGGEAAFGQLLPGQERTLARIRGADVEQEATGADRWTVGRVGGDGVVVTQDGRGSGAAGFVTRTARAADGGGLSVARCGTVVDDAWFLGLGTADKRSSTLVLANLSDTPAVADVTLWSARGEVDAVNAQGIAVSPMTIRRIPLADLAAGEPELAMLVQRRRGALSAMVQDASTARFAGTELIAGTSAPSREQLLAGIDGGARGKTLLLVNPGDQVARVDVTVLTGDGPVADEKLQQIRVQPGRYRQITVPPAVGGGAQSALVVSDRPVVSAMRVGPTTKDFAVAEAAPPIDGPTLVPVSLGRGTSLDRLILTAPGEDAQTAVVTTFDDRMRQTGRVEVEVAGRSTTSLARSKLGVDRDTAYLTVSAGGGLVGAASYRAGTGTSSLALTPPPTILDVPPVLPD